MASEQATTSISTPSVTSAIAELEVPFPPDQIQWRVTNTAKDKKRGQIVPYADPRAYADRLNALFTPQGWTREYKIETMSNITRMKNGESIVTGKILVTCTVTIIGLWSHSGTGEEWADDQNGMTSADAQAFKRACACFGLGRYFYEFQGSWVDLDQNQQPKRIPALPAWAIPENWRKGIRPPRKNCKGNGFHADGANGSSDGSPKANGRQVSASASLGADDLDTRILAMEKAVGLRLYRNILRRYGQADQPKLIKDASTKRAVLEVLASAARGCDRLNAVRKRIDPKMLESLLAKLQSPPLAEIADMKTLRNVVFGLEELADSPSAHKHKRSIANASAFPSTPSPPVARERSSSLLHQRNGTSQCTSRQLSIFVASAAARRLS